MFLAEGDSRYRIQAVDPDCVDRKNVECMQNSRCKRVMTGIRTRISRGIACRDRRRGERALRWTPFVWTPGCVLQGMPNGEHQICPPLTQSEKRELPSSDPGIGPRLSMYCTLLSVPVNHKRSTATKAKEDPPKVTSVTERALRKNTLVFFFKFFYKTNKYFHMTL